MTVTSSLIAKMASLSLAVSPPSDLPTYCQRDCELSDNGAALIRLFEGYSPFVYNDVGGLATIGYGHLIVKGEKFKEPLMPEDANKLLMKDAGFAVKGLNKGVKVKLKQNQADSLISFIYNVGVGAFNGSTLIKKVNAMLHNDVPFQILRWDKVKGKVVFGLTNRRTAEAAMYQK